jgi:hypothetical protein
MSHFTYDQVRKRVSESLAPQIKEFRKTVLDISGNFRDLGLETAVWHPNRIHTVNHGGIDADSYVGYSRIEGRWGLVIRIVERDCEKRTYVSQRIVPIESCSNMEMVVSALEKVPELMASIEAVVEFQIKLMEKPGPEFAKLRRPDCEF